MQDFLTDINNYRELSGHSGAKILLCNSKGNQFVRKIAKDQESSKRLEIQAKKQSNFQKLINNLFYVPEVINSGKINGIFYFDMEFVKGPDGAQFLRYAELEEVKNLSTKLQEYLELISSSYIDDKYNKNVSSLESKINLICENENILTKPHKKIIKSIKYIQKLKEKETISHGDLTLENFIIGRSGKIYLLDLLNPPVNHWSMDLTKLLQDISGGWYQRKCPQLPKYTVNYLEKSLLQKSKSINPDIEEIYKILLVCNFIRILPYSNSEAETDFIKEKIYFFGDKL